ncbi:hypothetical protein L873DRAFT_764218 [Choiromyces venosus 120613-1]|uniref:Uncharacterized protein n=1 Tax=Choiromyces venosus 120613-1 TaxID=1336337 RepID=A0A3N4JRA4_9PEZI|nr:hypothetical protein L873DRAFT_764218 [Choiromyces venosus 120613-1]
MYQSLVVVEAYVHTRGRTRTLGMFVYPLFSSFLFSLFPLNNHHGYYCNIISLRLSLSSLYLYQV